VTAAVATLHSPCYTNPGVMAFISANQEQRQTHNDMSVDIETSARIIVFTMARKKQGNGRDSNAKRLGTKIYGGQPVKPGNIIVRQRGTRILPGTGTRIGDDDTIYSVSEGILCFTHRKGKTIATVTPPSK